MNNNDNEIINGSEQKSERNSDDICIPLYFSKHDDSFPDDQEKKVQYKRLMTFYSEQTKKHYIIYTDNTYIDEHNLVVRAGVFDPEAPFPEKTIKGLGYDDEIDWKICVNEVKKRNKNARDKKI